MGDRYRDIDRDGKTRKHIDEKYPAKETEKCKRLIQLM